MREQVTCRVDGPIAHVRLNRPEKRNALTLPMLLGLAATARRLRADREVRGVVLGGHGAAFCAGLDLGAVLADRRGLVAAFLPRPWRGTNAFQEACWAWRRLPVPVVAAVHGHCLGGGLQLALGADFRLTTPDARWSVLEGRWGLVPDMTGVRTLAEQVGKDTAKRLTMTAEVVTGSEAARIGLATEAVPDPYAAASDLLERVVERSPDAVAAAKALFERTWTAGPRRTFARERAAQLRLLRLPNTGRARRAAAAGEPARFQPRS